MGVPQMICPWSFLGGFSDTQPPTSSSAQTIQKPKTFASVLVGTEENIVSISQLPSPTIRGDTVFVKINEVIYQEQLKACRTNLIGRLLLRKGSTPVKTESLKTSLNSLWQPLGPWRLVPIGKGYFDLHFDSEADLCKVWGGGTCTLESGIFRLSQWQPDFKPGDTLPQTHAQVWIRISGLSQEYWHQQHIMEIARGIGIPLQLDVATKEQRFGYYARVLVDVDLLGPLPSSVMVEREHLCFPVGIDYENLPPRCNHCSLIGHETPNCRQLKSKEAQMKQKEVRQQYRLKKKVSTIPKDSGAPTSKATSSSLLVRDGNETEEVMDTTTREVVEKAALTKDDSPIPGGVVDFVNNVIEEVTTDFLEELADKVMTEPVIEQSDVANHFSDASPSRSWHDIVDEEMNGDDEIHVQSENANVSSYPPGFGPDSSRAAVEIDAVAHFVDGRDMEGFSLVLTKSQKKKLKRQKKVVVSSREPYPSRVRQKSIRLQ